MRIRSATSEAERGAAPATAPFLSTPQLEQRLALAQHLIEYGTRMVQVLGEPGAGKSSFCAELERRAPPNWRVARVTGSAAASAAACLRALADGLGLDGAGTDPQRLRLDLELHVGACARADLLPVMLIDDADVLPAPTLQVILALAAPAAQAPRVRALLSGGPALTGQVQAAAADGSRDALSHRIELPPLTETQTADLLGRHLAEGETGLDLDAVRRIHREAGGRPGRVLELAAAALHQRAGTAARLRTRLAQWRRSGAHPRSGPAAAVVGVVVLAVAIASYWLRPGAQKPPPVERIELPLPAAPGTPAPARGPAPAPTPATETDKAPLTSPAAQVPAPAPAAARDVDAQGAGPSAPAEPPRDRDAGARSAAAAGTTPAAPARPEPMPAQAQPAPEPRAPAPAPASSPARQEEPDWLASAPAHQYALQLFGSHERTAAEAFIREHGIDARAAWFQTRYQGRPWYVVVYGPYPDRASAVAAVAGLHPALRRLGPWPRSLADIRAAAP